MRITENEMTSELTEHLATRDAVEKNWWWVSWLPKHQVCDRNQAITAMTIAEFVAHGVTPGHEKWPHVRNWAAELNLTAEQASALVAQSPSAPPLIGQERRKERS